MMLNPNQGQPVTIHIEGLPSSFVLHLHDDVVEPVSEGIRQHGMWESFETALMIAALKMGDNVVDAGANLGWFSAVAANCVGVEGRVFAFEPEPKNYALLTQNIAENGLAQVMPLQKALGAEAGEVHLYLSEENLGDHQLIADTQRTSISVEMVRGNDAVAEEKIQFLKVDTQGAETGVVEGLFPLLQRSGNELHIMLEFWPYGLRQLADGGFRLLEMLASLNLPLYTIDHINHHLKPTTFSELEDWIKFLEIHPEDEGFFNLFLGEPPTNIKVVEE